MNLFDYVKKYGNYPFEIEPFNEVDNVIFSQISYLPLTGIVSGFGCSPITLERTARMLDKKIKTKQQTLNARLYKKIYKLLLIMKEMPRYRDILLYNYVQIIDHQRQFGAITLRLPDKSIYISYEGTDGSISGWYEDACMAYTYPVPAQELAVDYLKKTINIFDKNIRVGGHSKGGNLAVAAALEAPFYIKNKIIKVYNNDGPGFFKELFDTRKYQKLLPKIQKIVPRESVVGMCLYQEEELSIVKSKSKRILQHDPFNWVIDENKLLRDTLSDFSKNVSTKTNSWITKLDKNERQQCIEDLFDAFDSSDINETYHLYSVTKTKKFLKNLYYINDSSKKNLIDVFKEIIW